MTATISQVAGRLGVSTDTLRYYERLGLIPAPARTPTGYRIYTDALAERLRFVKGAQSAGLQLADIKELLEINDRGACPCGHTTLVVQRRLTEVDAELARLRAVREQLVALGERNDSCADLSAESWWCSTAISQEGGDPP